MYNKVTCEDISALQRIVGESEVFTGSAINEDYSHDELGGISQMPEVLVRVRSTEEVSKTKTLLFHAFPV